MKKRRIYYPRCDASGKVRYPTNSIANMTRANLIRTGKSTTPLRHYYCNDCKGYHLGQNTDKWGAA